MNHAAVNMECHLDNNFALSLQIKSSKAIASQKENSLITAVLSKIALVS